MKELFPISKALASELEALETYLKGQVSSDIPLIEEVARYVIENGGKRLRPILTIFSAKLFGVQALAAIPFAATVEYIHTASLLHDDVIDSASLRRGEPSANAKWGNPVSVLVGDFFYCRASEILANAKRLDILSLISTAIRRTTEGEVLEIGKLSDVEVSEADYLKIIYHKTGILMAASCEIGALLGEASLAEQVALRTFGENLGMAFQLADDILDYVSDHREFGKKKGVDLKEGKFTLPVIDALKHANEADRAQLKRLFLAGKSDLSHVEEVRSILAHTGSIDRSFDCARHYVELAKQSLAVFKESPEKAALMALADYAMERSY